MIDMDIPVGEIITIALGAMSALLSIGIALAWLEGQWATVRGEPSALANVANKIIYLAVCGMLVTGATTISNILWGLLVSGQDSAAGLAQGFVRVGLIVVNTVLVAASIMITLGILSGAVAGQYFITLGNARGWSEAKARIVGAAIFGVGALFTIPIANFIVSAVSR